MPRAHQSAVTLVGLLLLGVLVVSVWAAPARAVTNSPDVTTPENGATVTEREMRVCWTEVLGAIFYSVEVLGPGNSGVRSQHFSQESCTFIPTPKSNGTYGIVVSPVGAPGLSHSSAVISIHVNLQPPVPPEILSPSDGAVVADEQVIITWVRPDGARRFYVDVGKEGESPTVGVALAGWQTSYAFPTDQLTSGEYVVSIRAVFDEVELVSSVKFRLQARGPDGHAAVGLSCPGPVTTDRDFFISWSGDNSATRYHITITNVSEGGALVFTGATSSSSFRVSSRNLNVGDTYEVQLEFARPNGHSSFSRCHFVVRNPPVQPKIAPPDVLSPADHSLHQTGDLTVKWSRVSGAVKYLVNVERQADRQDVVDRADAGTGIEMKISKGTIADPGSYLIEVGAVDVDGLENWQTGITVYVVAPPVDTEAVSTNVSTDDSSSQPVERLVNQPIVAATSQSAAGGSSSTANQADGSTHADTGSPPPHHGTETRPQTQVNQRATEQDNRSTDLQVTAPASGTKAADTASPRLQSTQNLGVTDAEVRQRTTGTAAANGTVGAPSPTPLAERDQANPISNPIVQMILGLFGGVLGNRLSASWGTKPMFLALSVGVFVGAGMAAVLRVESMTLFMVITAGGGYCGLLSDWFVRRRRRVQISQGKAKKS